VGRPPKFSKDQMLDSALALVAQGGPTALSVSAVADRLGAPSGSIYHRFGSRDLLAASLWLRSLENFQEGLLASLQNTDAVDAVLAAATHVLRWSRANLTEAQMLLQYRSSDLLTDGWPDELRDRNRDLRRTLDSAVDEINHRIGAVNATDRRRVTFALIDIPYGAVRGPLGRGRPPEPELDAIVADAVIAVLKNIRRA
jgi:AcrR family transcriptional regulator